MVAVYGYDGSPSLTTALQALIRASGDRQVAAIPRAFLGSCDSKIRSAIIQSVMVSMVYLARVAVLLTP